MNVVKIEIYEDELRRWRWRFISRKHSLAESSQGYVSKQGCLDALKRARSILSSAEIIDISKTPA